MILKDWYDFLTQEFALHRSLVRNRDRVVASCVLCGVTSVVLVSNLKTLVKRRGLYSCFSCNASRSAKTRKPRTTSKVLSDYVLKYKGVASGHLRLTSRVEFPCHGCGALITRGLKHLLKMGAPPTCFKCLSPK